MWQLETDATKASSGSTAFGLDQGAGTTAGAATPPSDQDTSAGSTRFAIRPGGRNDAAIASAASAPTSSGALDVRLQPCSQPVSASMSLSSGASKPLW